MAEGSGKIGKWKVAVDDRLDPVGLDTGDHSQVIGTRGYGKALDEIGRAHV